MKPSNEEVYQALITLQNLCSEIDDCLKCPLWNDKAGNIICTGTMIFTSPSGIRECVEWNGIEWIQWF